MLVETILKNKVSQALYFFIKKSIDPPVKLVSCGSSGARAVEHRAAPARRDATRVTMTSAGAGDTYDELPPAANFPFQLTRKLRTR